MRRNEPVTDREYVLSDDDVILSKTNLTGHITYVNESLLRITGFTEDELIGQPHNVFRHPDMPPEAFEDLWNTIRAGRNWRGYVKNRCKNGDFYWVDASVTPNFESGRMIGFTSYRVKAPREAIRRMSDLYRQVRAGNAGGVRLREGRLVARGPRGYLAALASMSLRRKLGSAMLALALTSVLGVAGMVSGLVTTSVVVVTMTIMLALAGTFAWRVLSDFEYRMTDAIRILQGVSSGNFNQQVESTSGDEIGQLMGSLRNLVGNLRETIRQVNGSTDTVSEAAGEIALGNDNLSQRTTEQAASLEETASSMEEMTATVKRNAENARSADRLAHEARDGAESGGRVLGETVEAMSAISESSERIAEIIGVIDEIAFQTNLLALNAAVESARAGEQGRGFAVVASEVRNLAQRSSGAAAEIKALIGESVEKTRHGSEIVHRSSESLNEIVSGVVQVSEIVTEIAAASEEQAAGIEQVNRAISQMDQTTQQNAALVEEAAANARSMAQQSRHLQMVTRYFTLSGSETASATQRVRDSRADRRDRLGHAAGLEA